MRLIPTIANSFNLFTNDIDEHIDSQVHRDVYSGIVWQLDLHPLLGEPFSDWEG
jgi:hypothetical protein